MPTAFAIALDVPVQELINIIGHDGSEILFPEDPEPFCRRGFHPQEIIDVCLLKQFGVIAIHNQPVSELKSGMYTVPVSSERMPYYLENYSGVLTGIGYTGQPHAVAWGAKIYDPNGLIYDLENFNIEQFFIIVKINITL